MQRSVRKYLAQFGSLAAATLRCEPRAVRRLPVALVLIAAGLTAWVFELGAVLQGQAEVRNWSSVWVGLDLLEITGLVITAFLIKRRSVFLPSTAAATATLFALDAWFDVLTSAAGSAWYESLATAVLAEIPMTVVLAAISLWSAKTGSGTRQGLPRETPPATPLAAVPGRAAATRIPAQTVAKASRPVAR
jgi:hypothetical protein